MSAYYSIWLTNVAGERVKLLDHVFNISYTLTVNQIGIAQVDVPELPSDLFQEDSRLEIWRQVPGGKKYLEGDTCWIIRDWEDVLTQQGDEFVRLSAYSANFILDAPIVAYKSATSQAEKSDQADDMMKAIVRENLGSSASDSDRDLSTYITVDADSGDGPSTSKSFAHRNVLATLREIAQDADGQGTPLFFGLAYDPTSLGFTFSTRTQHWGDDHGKDGAGGRVVLSARNGTLSDVRRAYVSSEERTVIYVGGQGQGDDRQVEKVEDSERSGLTPFNRREYFVDARNSSGTATLQAEGRAALKALRPREIFSAKIRDTQAIRYGREYRFGDRVIAEHRGRVVEARLDSVRVRVARGREDINAELRADE